MATTCTTTVVRSRLVVDKPNIICRYTFVVGHRSAGSSKHNTTIFVWLSAAMVHDVNVVMSSFRERWMHPEWGRFPHPTRARQTSCNAQRQIPTRWIRNRARWCTDSWFLPGGQALRPIETEMNGFPPTPTACHAPDVIAPSAYIVLLVRYISTHSGHVYLTTSLACSRLWLPFVLHFVLSGRCFFISRYNAIS